MVPLVRVSSEFAGRVLVAKLGSAGIIAELRGVSRVYPALLGDPEVWVESTELGEAHELITAFPDDELAGELPDSDGTDAATADRGAARRGLGGHDDALGAGSSGPRSIVKPLIVAVAVVVLASLSIGPRACAPSGATAVARQP